MSPLSFVEQKKVGKSADEQDADGWNGVEIDQDPGAGDAVHTCDGQQKTQRRDDGDGEVSHVLPFVSKLLKEMKKY